MFGLSLSCNATLTQNWGGALVGHPSSDRVTTKLPYGVDVFLRQPALHPFFSY